jgi:hypothetical protein
MTPEQVLNEISSLTPSEQLKIAQVIWDKLPNDLGTDRHKLIDLHRALLSLYLTLPPVPIPRPWLACDSCRGV